MTNEAKPSYELIYFSGFKIPESKNSSIATPKIEFSYSDIIYYSEIYEKPEFIIKRMLFMYEFQIEGFKKLNMDILSSACCWRQFYVTNKYGETPLTIGITPHGWDLLSHFTYYLLTHFENHYGEENYIKMLEEKANNIEMNFSLDRQSEPLIIPIYQLISQETALVVLKNHLEAKELEDIDPAIYHREIEKRNYQL